MRTIQLHPEFLSKSGEKEYAIIPYGEFLQLNEWINDRLDLLDLDEAIRIEGTAPDIPLEEVERRYGVPIA